MPSPIRRIAKFKSWKSQATGVLCGLLGLIWAGNPIFHNVCHLIDLPHQHPTGPAFSDGHSHGHGHGHSQGHHHGPGHSHTHLTPSSRLSDDATASEQNPGSDPDSPDREPKDSEGPLLLIQALEIETCCPMHHRLHLKQVPPALDTVNLDRFIFFSSVRLGATGARGPPITQDLF